MTELEQQLVESLEWFIENDETNRGGRWEEENRYWIEGLETGRKLVAQARGLPYEPEDYGDGSGRMKFTIQEKVEL